MSNNLNGLQMPQSKLNVWGNSQNLGTNIPKSLQQDQENTVKKEKLQEEFMLSFDLNNDGKIDPDEMQEMAESLSRQLTSDKDGKIDAAKERFGD